MPAISPNPKEPHVPHHHIAVIAGDGIGNPGSHARRPAPIEAGPRFGLPLEFHTFDWAHCDYYLQHGKMMPDDWKAQLSGMDAIFFGAVGWPATVPDHIRCGARC